MPPPTLDEFVAMSAAQDTETESSQESDAGIMSAASTAFKPPPLGGSAAVSGTNTCAVTLLAPQLEAAAVTSQTPLQAAARWLGATTGPNGATVKGPIALAAAPVPTAVVPSAATSIPSSIPLPQVLRQYIEIFEPGIMREYEVMTKVECIPVRDWLPGGMAYDELYKGMNVDPKVFDFDVRIITILDGPLEGKVFVLAQDVYRIAKGVGLVRQTIEKIEHCTEAGVEKIVGPNIVQKFKYSSHHSAGKHPAIPFKAGKPDAKWETYPHMKYIAELNANFRHYCVDIAGDTLSGNTRALHRINDAIHNPSYEQRLMQGNGENLPLSERSEEVRENADGEVEAVLRQTTSVDDEGRSATVNEYHNYVTQGQVDRLLDEAKKQLREQMNEEVERKGRELFDALQKHRHEHKKEIDFCIKVVNAVVDRMVDILGAARQLSDTQTTIMSNVGKISTNMGRMITTMGDINSGLSNASQSFRIVDENFSKLSNAIQQINDKIDDNMRPNASAPQQNHRQLQGQRNDEPEEEELGGDDPEAEQAPPPPAPTESIQAQHLPVTKKRKAYQMYIQRREGFEVMVADVMQEAPKLYPDVFKKGMSYEEANDVLALACSGSSSIKEGRKKIKFIQHTFEDGTKAKFKGAPGFMLVPKPAVPPPNTPNAAPQQGNAPNADVGEGLVGGIGEVAHSQDAADILLSFANHAGWADPLFV